MQVILKPDTQKFVDEQIRSGRFRSAEELLDEAVHRMMIESEGELDDETAEGINRAEEQIDRGEGIDFDKFAAEMRKRIAAK
jgi:antitoxin ParD1/3/4